MHAYLTVLLLAFLTAGCLRTLPPASDLPTHPLSYNPLPVQFFISDKKLPALELEAYKGSRTTAEALYSHYLLVMRNQKAADHWLLLGAYNGSPNLIESYCADIEEVEDEFERKRLCRFVLWATNTHSNTWTSDERNSVLESMKDVGISTD